MVWGTRLTKALRHLLVATQLGFASRPTRHDGGKVAGHIIHIHIACHKFRDYLTTCHKVDKRDVGYLEQKRTNTFDKPPHPHVVAHNLWHAEESRLERGGSTGNKGSLGMLQDAVGLIVEYANGQSLQDGFVELWLNAWSTGQNELIAIGVWSRCLYHTPQVIVDFLASTACQKSQDRLVRELVLATESHYIDRMLLLVGSHLVDGRIAHIVDGIVMLLFEEIDLEGKDGEKLVNIALDGLDAVFLPSPYLR